MHQPQGLCFTQGRLDAYGLGDADSGMQWEHMAPAFGGALLGVSALRDVLCVSDDHRKDFRICLH